MAETPMRSYYVVETWDSELRTALLCLGEDVKTYLGEGWICVGGVEVAQTDKFWYAMQAMVHPEDYGEVGGDG